MAMTGRTGFGGYVSMDRAYLEGLHGPLEGKTFTFEVTQDGIRHVFCGVSPEIHGHSVIFRMEQPCVDGSPNPQP